MNGVLDPGLESREAIAANSASPDQSDQATGRSRGERSTLVAAPDAQLLLALPELPQGRRAFRRVLAARSPLPLREVAWTRPFINEMGQARVVLVRRAYLDREAGALSYAGQQRLVAQTADGRRLLYTAPAARRRLQTTLAIVALCAVVSIAVLISGRAEPKANVPPSSVGRTVDPFQPVFARAGVLRSLAAAAQDVPDGATLTAVATGDAQDTVPIVAEYAVDDPDALRHAVGPSIRELGQSRQAQGGYVVSLGLPAVHASQTMDTVPILRALDTQEARSRVDERLRSLASGEVLQIALTEQHHDRQSLSIGLRTVGPQANVLSFVGAIEGGRPAMRFADWRVERDPAGVAFSGTLLVPVNLSRGPACRSCSIFIRSCVLARWR